MLPSWAFRQLSSWNPNNCRHTQTSGQWPLLRFSSSSLAPSLSCKSKTGQELCSLNHSVATQYWRLSFLEDYREFTLKTASDKTKLTTIKDTRTTQPMLTYQFECICHECKKWQQSRKGQCLLIGYPTAPHPPNGQHGSGPVLSCDAAAPTCSNWIKDANCFDASALAFHWLSSCSICIALPIRKALRQIKACI